VVNCADASAMDAASEEPPPQADVAFNPKIVSEAGSGTAPRTGTTTGLVARSGL
jgi:hypothetical protein